MAWIKFSEKFDHPFSHVFIFGNMFPESRGFVAVPVTSCIKDTCSNLSLSNYWRGTKLFGLVTGTTTKPRLSGNMFLNIKTCGNGLSDFSENLRVTALKMLEFTRFLSPNLSIYFNFVRCWGSVVMLTFLNTPPVRCPFIEKLMVRLSYYLFYPRTYAGLTD